MARESFILRPRAVLSADTHLEAEQVLVGLWRRQRPEQKVATWLALQQSCWSGLYQSTEGDRRSFWRRWYGLTSQFNQESILRKGPLLFMDPLQVAERVSQVLARLGRRCLVVGSVASSFYGEVRQTQDIDLLVELQLADVATLLAELADDFYLSESAAREAILRKSSFHLIHFDSSTKVDLFVTKNRAFERSRFERSRSIRDGLQVASPEDILLAKLEWYQSSQGTLEKQWRDILGILAVQTVDLEYLRTWAESLALGPLLEKALVEVEPLR